MRLRNPQWLAVVVAVAVLSSVAGCGSGSAHPTPSAKALPPTAADAHAVAQALAALPDKPADYVATDVRSAVTPQLATALPTGATLSADEATWHPDGLDGGTITVTMTAPGTPPAVFSAVMIKEPSGWKVVGTMPMNPGAPPAATGTAPVAPPAQAPAENPPPTPKAKKHKKAAASPSPSADPGSTQ
jgi:hypothetical protein